MLKGWKLEAKADILRGPWNQEQKKLLFKLKDEDIKRVGKDVFIYDPKRLFKAPNRPAWDPWAKILDNWFDDEEEVLTPKKTDPNKEEIGEKTREEILTLIEQNRKDGTIDDYHFKSWTETVRNCKYIGELKQKVEIALVIHRDDTSFDDQCMRSMLKSILVILLEPPYVDTNKTTCGDYKIHQLALIIDDFCFWPHIFIDRGMWVAQLVATERKDTPLIATYGESPNEAIEKIYNCPLDKLKETFENKFDRFARRVEWLNYNYRRLGNV